MFLEDGPEWSHWRQIFSRYHHSLSNAQPILVFRFSEILCFLEKESYGGIWNPICAFKTWHDIFLTLIFLNQALKCRKRAQIGTFFHTVILDFANKTLILKNHFKKMNYKNSMPIAVTQCRLKLNRILFEKFLLNFDEKKKNFRLSKFKVSEAKRFE